MTQTTRSHRAPVLCNEGDDKNSRTNLGTPRAARVRKQRQILQEAEQQFARFGFEGTSLESIATQLGISRQNMLYYYASKEELYLAVLDDVLASWLDSMDVMAKKTDPETAIASYIGAKLRFSQERPNGSAVFTREIMAGAPRYADKLVECVVPKLRADVQAFKRWARQGLIESVDFTHLMFIIWSATQAYADLAPQFALLEGRRRLKDSDFEAAHALLTRLIVHGLKKMPATHDCVVEDRRPKGGGTKRRK